MPPRSPARLAAVAALATALLVPAGATLVSGQGTGSISVNWGTTGGDLTATVTTGCYSRQIILNVAVEPAFNKEFSFENFDQAVIKKDVPSNCINRYAVIEDLSGIHFTGDSRFEWGPNCLIQFSFKIGGSEHFPEFLGGGWSSIEIGLKMVEYEV